MADNSVRNLKNPLLSANITGFSLDDLTQNPVLLPVQPKPTPILKEQSASAPQNINEESFSEISLDSDSQDNAPITVQEEIKSPLLDLDSSVPDQPIRPSSTNSNGSAFSQVTNQASQLSAQLSQLPSVASSVLSSFSNILGRGSSSTSNQPKEPEVYRSPLDNLLAQSDNQQNPVPLQTIDPSASGEQNQPSASVVPPPPVPLFSSGQVPSVNNQKYQPPSNTFRLGGIKKKTYAQIPGLNTSHVQHLVEAPLQPSTVLPTSTQPSGPTFFKQQTVPLHAAQPIEQTQQVAGPQSNFGNFFQSTQPQVPQSAANQFTPTVANQFTPTVANPPITNFPPTKNTIFNVPPAPVNQGVNIDKPPLPEVSNFFVSQPNAPVLSSQNLVSNSLNPSSNVHSGISAFPPTAQTTNVFPVGHPPPTNISYFTQPSNLQATNFDQQLTCSLPKEVLPINNPPPSNIAVFNPLPTSQISGSFSSNPLEQQQQQPPTTTPETANSLPPPPTKSSLNALNTNPSTNQGCSGNRNPFSIHSISKNRVPSASSRTENIAIFNPGLINSTQSTKEPENLQHHTSSTPAAQNPTLFSVQSAHQQQGVCETQSNVEVITNVQKDKNFNKFSPYLTVSPESEQNILNKLTPVNTFKPSADQDTAHSSKKVDQTNQTLIASAFQSAGHSENNSRKTSASSYFSETSNVNNFINVPENNQITSSNLTGPQSYFNQNNVNTFGSNITSQQSPAVNQPPPVQVSNFSQSNRVSSAPCNITNNKITTFPPSNFSNMDNNAANEAPIYEPVPHHWFHKKEVDSKVIWTPFSIIDSEALEKAFQSGNKNVIVATDGGRYDVNVTERTRSPVYWPGEVSNVRRCSWFFKAIDSRFLPYEENIADLLEAEYRNCSELNSWHRRIELPNDESVMLHGPTVLVHFLRGAEIQDSWSNAPPTANRPRVVKRGMLDFELDKGEPTKVDHLLFLVHGIGSVCDLKFRTVEEVVDEFRGISLQLVQSHYRSACEQGLVNRIEVLPVSWHGSLHSSETGIDDKLKAITLESIPKLREFTNGTLLDVLFYTSPVFCQTIMQTVGNELNRLYSLFMQRNPGYNGGVSLGGHSLGSLILFDLLCHQTPPEQETTKGGTSTDSEIELQEDDKVAPLNGRKPLKRALSKKINYVIGHAGTGQPFIKYPQLLFHPNTFFALGSPLGMFVTIRGIDALGLDFTLPTCPGFFNIFHPYDPVAYRVEALINPDLKNVRPVLIPHHKGRKRMHLELKETMSRVGADLKNRLMDSVKNTWNSVYQIAMFKGTQTLDDVVDKAIRQELQMKYSSTSSFEADGDNKLDENPNDVDLALGKLNGGRRIDYVLQEAPLEFFNEYIFALTSHVCYWESEDTMLIMIKEIYSSLGATTDNQIPQQTMKIERSVYPQGQFQEPCSSNFNSR